MQDLLELYIANTTRRSRAFTVPQTFYVALRFFVTGSFLYSVGDAENIGKAAACVAVRKVYLALTAHSHVRVGMRRSNGWWRRSLAHGVVLITEML